MTSSGVPNYRETHFEFKDLTPAIQAELPEYFVEKSQIEFDSEPLPETKTSSAP